MARRARMTARIKEPRQIEPNDVVHARLKDPHVGDTIVAPGALRKYHVAAIHTNTNIHTIQATQTQPNACKQSYTPSISTILSEYEWIVPHKYARSIGK